MKSHFLQNIKEKLVEIYILGIVLKSVLNLDTSMNINENLDTSKKNYAISSFFNRIMQFLDFFAMYDKN